MKVTETKKETIKEVLEIISQYVQNHDVISEYDIQDILDTQLNTNIDFVEFNVLCNLLQMQDYKVDYSDIIVNGKHDDILCSAMAYEEYELLSSFAA